MDIHESPSADMLANGKEGTWLQSGKGYAISMRNSFYGMFNSSAIGESVSFFTGKPMIAPMKVPAESKSGAALHEFLSVVVGVVLPMKMMPKGVGASASVGRVATADVVVNMAKLEYQYVPKVASSASLEAKFQVNSLHVADEAHGLFMQGIEDGSIPRNTKIPLNTQAGGFVDGAVRRSNLRLQAELGLDEASVRINQRLYMPSGRYTIPDLYFPQSGNIIDYSYQLKTATTRQIQGFRAASPNGIITIVPPPAIRPIYTIRP